MTNDGSVHDLDWTEESSQTFIDYGRYFVPAREAQIETICTLIPQTAQPFHVLELCCGEGLLAAAILERFPQAVVHGYDGSVEMLNAARARTAAFGERFLTRRFDLAAHHWRTLDWAPRAVVSSLAIHHLDGSQKQQLFADLHHLLQPGGALIIADLIEPAHALGAQVAAAAWDAAVRERAQQLDGNEAAFVQFQELEWNLYRHPDPMDKPSGLFEQLRWLQESGFVDVDAYWLQAGHAIYGGRKSG